MTEPDNGRPYSEFGELEVFPFVAWMEASKPGKVGLGKY